MLEGRDEQLQNDERRIAKWMAPLLSISAGSNITPGQLLGEEEAAPNPEQELAAKIKAGQKAAKVMERKLARARERKKKGA